jgi:hypothetical protein
METQSPENVRGSVLFSTPCARLAAHWRQEVMLLNSPRSSDTMFEGMCIFGQDNTKSGARVE